MTFPTTMKRNYEVRNDHVIQLIEGDISEYVADAIVCPSNPDLIVGGKGASGAIKKRAGPTLEEQAKRLKELYGDIGRGNVVVTTGGDLQTKYVLHAVCTEWDGDGYISNRRMIRESTEKSLRAADGLRLESIGFPALGTGEGGFQLVECVKIMLESFRSHLSYQTSLKRVGLVLYDRNDYEVATKVTDQKFR